MTRPAEKGPSGAVEPVDNYVQPAMRHGEQECWSFSLSAWAALGAWLITRALTRNGGYRA